MSTERPVASDCAIDSVMTRAQGARGASKSSLMWRSSAPRAPRKSLALGVAGVLAMAGAAGMASANHIPGNVVSPANACGQNTPVFVGVAANVGGLVVGNTLQIPGVLGDGQIVVLQADAAVRGRVRLQVCLVA